MTEIQQTNITVANFIIGEHGSIESAKQYADSKYTAPKVSSRLKEAIADVESYGGSHESN